MRTIAVLPVRTFEDAKQRLAPVLTPGARRGLAQAMYTDVLTALRRASRVDDIVVVTGDLLGSQVATGYGVEVAHDPDEQGQSQAAEIGIARALERGATRVLLVPGDCPAIMPAELDGLLTRSASAASVTLVADRHGTGTNALVLRPPEAITPTFGPNSRARHRQRALDAGADLTEADPTGLLLDVDTPEDLEALRTHFTTVRGGGAHTRGLLLHLGRAAA